MKQHRIPVSPANEGIQSPFASLEIEGLPAGPPDAKPPAEKPLACGRVVLRREKARRSGKTVVVVSGFADSIPLCRIEELAKNARHLCGCGGTVRNREIELQGNQPERVRQFFHQEGFQVAGV